jgi:MFS family permease
VTRVARLAQPTLVGAPPLGRIVASLCVTEIVSYGVLYYAFTVLNAAIVADTGWPLVVTTMAFSVGQVVGAIGGIAVGRIIDRRGPRAVMTAGSITAVPAICLIARAPNSASFIVGWAVAGTAMSAVLYTPAFSVITHWGGARALQGLTTVTLVAGFASTIFGPLTAHLESALGWRATFLVLAVALGVLTIPTHWFGLRGNWVPTSHVDKMSREGDGSELTGRFVILAVAMSLATLAEYGALVQLVPLLVSRGLDTSQAAIVLGVGGAGQVVGRVFYRRIAAAVPLVARTVVMFLLIAVTTALFPLVPANLSVLLVVTVFAGLARGLVTLLLATAIPDRWGGFRIGRRNGLLSAPVMFTAAVAPFVAAVVQHWTGPKAVFYLLALTVALASLLIPLTVPDRLPYSDRSTRRAR